MVTPLQAYSQPLYPFASNYPGEKENEGRSLETEISPETEAMIPRSPKGYRQGTCTSEAPVAGFASEPEEAMRLLSSGGMDSAPRKVGAASFPGPQHTPELQSHTTQLQGNGIVQMSRVTAVNHRSEVLPTLGGHHVLVQSKKVEDPQPSLKFSLARLGLRV